MATVLVTGATGLVGRVLVPRLAEGHDVVVLSRGEPQGPGMWARGNFAIATDLRALDAYRIDAAVHLAAVLDDAAEEVCLRVNVAGTATLLRYLVGRGCRRCILASSIGATGCLDERFLPRSLPIDDDHPYDTADPYGTSKALMEELARYFQRQTPDLEVTLVRIGAVVEADLDFYRATSLERSETPFTLGGVVSVADVAEALARAVERDLGPGVRRFNLTGPTSLTRLPVAEALRIALGDRVTHLSGLGCFEGSRRGETSLFARDRVYAYLGMRPTVDPRSLL